MDAFDRRFGDTQGRIVPVNASPFDGDWVFCFGSDVAGEQWDLNVNDGIELRQNIDLTGIKLVRFNMRLRGPSSMPANHGWFFRWYISTIQNGARQLTDNLELDIEDGAFDTSLITGVQTLRFKLSLESTP
jgi:hypothetical protein